MQVPLDDEARATIDHALALEPPLHPSATDEELAAYAARVGMALLAFAPWTHAVGDQLEVVTLLRTLTRLHEVHPFCIDEDGAGLFETLKGMRQSRDSLVASLSRTLVARFCSLQPSVIRDSRTQAWRTEVWGS